MDRNSSFDGVPLHVRKEAHRLCFGKHEARWPIDDERKNRLLADEVSWKTLVFKKRKKGLCHVTSTWFDYYCFVNRIDERASAHRIDLPVVPKSATTKTPTTKTPTKTTTTKTPTKTTTTKTSTTKQRRAKPEILSFVDLTRTLADEQIDALGEYCRSVLDEVESPSDPKGRKPKRVAAKPGDVVVMCDGNGNERRFLWSDEGLVPFDHTLDADGALPLVRRFRAIERFPINYWKDTVKHNAFVWCDLTNYIEEIWNNLERFAVPEKTSRKKEGATIYTSRFVYRNDFVGQDNRYDLVVVYELARDFVLDRDELAAILKRGLFEHSDRSRLHQGTSDDVNPHNTLYYVY